MWPRTNCTIEEGTEQVVLTSLHQAQRRRPSAWDIRALLKFLDAPRLLRNDFLTDIVALLAGNMYTGDDI